MFTISDAMDKIRSMGIELRPGAITYIAADTRTHEQRLKAEIELVECRLAGLKAQLEQHQKHLMKSPP